MLVPFRKILADAHQRGYAIGAFNCLSTEHIMGAIQAAEQLRSPIILQVAEIQFPYAPLELMVPAFLEAAQRATVPVAVHLDHGLSFETCIKALRLGCNSVMFDGASFPFEENVTQTSLVVRAAKAVGADIEAELGHVGDAQCSADIENDIFTVADEAKTFIERTGVDALAIAIGNLHGKYIATPQLNITRLKEINSLCNTPLVLHGGSGTSEEDFKACAHNGVAKINVATALQIAVTKAIESYLVSTDTPNYIDMKNIIVEATKESVAWHIRLFESDGKA
ncbi:MAG: class II fructose-bisphosphate aldolase [Tidjanibacter sp.]|nr:class II fructose-bisphosphate aldolase [Tidjanibacter sp.]